MNIGYMVIIGIFLVYYFVLLWHEGKFLVSPVEIMDKFLSIVLLYAGVSIIFFSLTGQGFLGDTEETYTIYIFIIGFIAMMWAIPNLLREFKFFDKIMKKNHIDKKLK